MNTFECMCVCINKYICIHTHVICVYGCLCFLSSLFPLTHKIRGIDFILRYLSIVTFVAQYLSNFKKSEHSRTPSFLGKGLVWFWLYVGQLYRVRRNYGLVTVFIWILSIV